MTIIEITAALLVDAYDNDDLIPASATVHDVWDGKIHTRLTLDGVNVTADDGISLHWTLTDASGALRFFDDVFDAFDTVIIAVSDLGADLPHELI